MCRVTELKPCPFCGGTKLKIERKSTLYGYNGCDERCERHTYSVRCNVCKCRGGAVGGYVALRYVENANPKLTTDDVLQSKAIEAWNRRVQE